MKCLIVYEQVEDYNMNAAEDDAYIEVKDSDFKALKDEKSEVQTRANENQ